MAMTATELIPQWTVSDRLRKARQEAKMDQETMAEVFGVSAATISNWENGTQPTRRPWTLPAVVAKWAEVTGVPERWLWTGLGYNPEVTSDLGERHLTSMPTSGRRRDDSQRPVQLPTVLAVPDV